MTESPILPQPLTQNYSRPQRPSSLAARPREPRLDKWKSRVPKTRNSPLVPEPLFSSAKTVVETEPTAASSEVAAPSSSSLSNSLGTISDSATITVVPTTEAPTPISPSPSLFPIPPSANGIMVSPVSIVSPLTLHASNSVLSRSSVYSQSTTGTITASARPRPVSSVYSQKTLATIAATGPPSPRTPTMTNWTSTLPGLPSSGIPQAEAHMSMNAFPQTHIPVNMEQVAEEQPTPQYIQPLIQVPRLRSPSVPQDRGSRRRTISDTASMNPLAPRRDMRSASAQHLVQSPEPSPPPPPHAGINTPPPPPPPQATEYHGPGWPLQQPSIAHTTPQKHHVSRSQLSNVPEPPYPSHIANKESISSSFTQSPPIGHPLPDAASPRVSLADSRTPIYGPGEQQRSGWWSDEEDPEQGRRARRRDVSISVYAAMGLGEKAGTEAQRRRTRKIRIMAGAIVLAILIIVGVVLGVVFGTRH